jgi:hypothetical protein
MKLLSLPCGTHPSDTVTSLCVFLCGTHPSAPFTAPFSTTSLNASSPALTCTAAAPEMLLPSSCSSSLSPPARWRKRPRPQRRRRKHRLRPGCSIGDALLELKTGPHCAHRLPLAAPATVGSGMTSSSTMDAMGASDGRQILGGNFMKMFGIWVGTGEVSASCCSFRLGAPSD